MFKKWKLFLPVSLSILTPLSLVSCVTTEQENPVIKNNLNLDVKAFLNQNAVQSVLDEVYKKDFWDEQSQEELDKQKQEYIDSQLLEKNIKKLDKEMEKIYANYSFARLQTNAAIVSIRKIDFWRPNRYNPLIFTKYSDEWDEFKRQNWLYLLYRVNCFTAVGYQFAKTSDSTNFRATYRNSLPITWQMNSNQIIDYASEKFPLKSGLWSDQPTPKEGDNYQFSTQLFLFKYPNDTFLKLNIVKEQKWTNNTSSRLKTVTFAPDNAFRSFQRTFNKEVKDYSASEVLPYIIDISRDLVAKNDFISLDIPDSGWNPDFELAKVEDKFGSYVSWIFADFIVQGDKND
ncbi:aromatic motif membrane protein [Mycoplasma sp. 128]